MKAIKKVSTVPLVSNSGTIIDSFNTSDNKHTNAPSLNAVESKLIEVNATLKAKGDFISITTDDIQVTSDKGMYIQIEKPYPEGFTWDNMHLISTEIIYRTTPGVVESQTVGVFMSNDMPIVNDIMITCWEDNNKFAIRGRTPQYQNGHTIAVRIILMKI